MARGERFVDGFVGTVLLPLATAPTVTTSWERGPLPLERPDGTHTDTDARSTYFDQRAGGVIYGQRRRCDRRWRNVDQHVDGPFSLVALEWLRLPEHSSTAGILIVHVSAEVDDATTFLTGWSRLVRWKLDDRGRHALLEAVSAAAGAEIALVAMNREPFRVGFLTQQPDDTLRPFPSSTLDPESQWLLALASAIPPGSFSPSREQNEEFAAARVPFSSDWSAMVLRDGASFVGHPDTNPGFIEQHAPILVRTIYADSLLVGVLQHLALADLSDRLAALEDPARHPRGVERLDAEFSRFRNRLWWQHLTQHGPGNQLLLAYQRQHRLVELMEQTKSELEDYSRQTSLRASRVLNVVVAVFALIGTLSVGIDLYQLFNPPPITPGQTTIAWSSAVLGSGLVLMVAYPLGGISRWLPRRRRPYTPGRRQRKTH